MCTLNARKTIVPSLAAVYLRGIIRTQLHFSLDKASICEYKYMRYTIRARNKFNLRIACWRESIGVLL